MKPASAIRATLKVIVFASAIALLLGGCSDSNEMSQDEIQYLGHLDQSRFFQRQGELKASTLEARSAMTMQPDRIDPYFIIINNLLTAGDARNAERQLDALMEQVDPSDISQQSLNDAALLRAEARLRQQQAEAALEALTAVANPDRAHETEVALLKGHIQLASGNPDSARQAYQQARELAPASVEPLVGLSKAAFSDNRKQEAAEFISEAEEIDPQHVELWLWKASVAHADERWVDAEKAYVSALETIGQYDVMTYRKFETMSSLIDVLRRQGKAAEAFVYEEILAKSAPGTLRSNLIAAQEAFREGNSERAARFLEEVLAQAPDQQQASMMLGVIRFRQGRAAEAEKLLAPVAAMDGSDQINRLLAATRLQLRDPEGAKEILANIDDQDSDPATLALVGIASLVSGDREGGERLIEKSLDLNPGNNSLRLRYANYHLQNGDRNQAMKLAEDAIDRDPENAQAMVILGNLELSDGNEQQARKFYTDALRLAPDSRQALQSLSAITSREDMTALMAELHKANPEAMVPGLMLLESALINGDRARADELTAGLAEREEQNRPTAAESLVAGVYNSIATQMAQRGRNEEAAAIFARGRALFPEDEPLGLRAAALQFHLGNTTEARKMLSDVKQAHPDSPAPFVIEARYSEQQQDFTKAAELYQRALDKEPENPALMMSLASLYQTNKELDEAISLYRELIRLQPDHATAMNNLAWIYQEQGKEEALDLALKAYELNPRNAAIADTYGWILLKNGQQAESVDILETALGLAPGSREIATHLAEAYKTTGDDDKAREILEKLQ